MVIAVLPAPPARRGREGWCWVRCSDGQAYPFLVTRWNSEKKLSWPLKAGYRWHPSQSGCQDHGWGVRAALVTALSHAGDYVSAYPVLQVAALFLGAV